MDIKPVHDPKTRSVICDSILRALPEWFGIEESIVQYTKHAGEMPFYAAFDGDSPIGFIAVKAHNPFTAEVYVMGVLGGCHRLGVGTALMNRVEKHCVAGGFKFLTVKTLDSSAASEHYERTRRFYNKMGFLPLEVFPLLWDEANPCLFLVKHLASGGEK